MKLEVAEEVAQMLKAMEAKLRREAEVGKSFGEVDLAGALQAIDDDLRSLVLSDR